MTSNDQYMIAGKLMKALVFFLSNGDHFTHLEPLSTNLQRHLEGRNGHAHYGKCLASLVLICGVNRNWFHFQSLAIGRQSDK